MSVTDSKNTVNKTRFADANGIERFVLDTIDFSEFQFKDISMEVKYQISVFTDNNYVPLPTGENNFKCRTTVKLKLPFFLLVKLINSASAYKLPKKILNQAVKKFKESDPYFLNLPERKIIENFNVLLLKFRQIAGISEKLNSIVINEGSEKQEKEVHEPSSVLNIECIHDSKDKLQWGINISFSGKILTTENIPLINYKTDIKVKYFKNYFFSGKIN